MRKYIILPALLIIVVILFIWVYPNKEYQYQKIAGETQGTTYHITYQYKADSNLKPAIDSLLHKFDMSLSTYIPQSIISRINQNDTSVRTDNFFRTVFRESRRIHDNSNGLFDITVAPLVNMYGFGFAPGPPIDSADVDSLLQYVGMEKVHLKGNKVIKSNPSVMLDVNAIAQGYSVDVVCDFLEKLDIKNYLVEIGGEVRGKGVNAKGEDWRVGVDKPIDGNMIAGADLQAIIAIRNNALATSGNYRKFRIIKGVKYAHEINPKTGYPALSRLLSATVMTDKCMTADGYATALMVMGLDKSIDFLKHQHEIDALLIYSDTTGRFREYVTPGMKSEVLEEIN